MTVEQYTQAHTPAVATLPHSGIPEQDHLLDEMQHPDSVEAFHLLAERCVECGQTIKDLP
jgi:hypothetical protein